MICAYRLGNNTNNGVELMGLITGFQIAKGWGIHKLIVEGDSLLLISILLKIINEENPENLSTNWRISSGLIQVDEVGCHISMVIPNHVKRKEKSMAYHLANEGVTQQNNLHISRWKYHIPRILREECSQINEKYNDSLNGVTIDMTST
jgi:ribonuclease HI